MRKTSVLALILPFLAFLSLGACTAPPKKIEIVSSPAERIGPDLPAVDVISLDSFEWIVITPDNVTEIWTGMPEGKRALFALDAANYERLSLNTAKTIQLTRQQKSVIEAYRRYLEEEREKPMPESVENEGGFFDRLFR